VEEFEPDVHRKDGVRLDVPGGYHEMHTVVDVDVDLLRVAGDEPETVGERIAQFDGILAIGRLSIGVHLLAARREIDGIRSILDERVGSTRRTVRRSRGDRDSRRRRYCRRQLFRTRNPRRFIILE